MSRLKHKRGRKSKYANSLKHNPYWKEVVQMVRVRYNGKCVICGSILYLEVHHLTYKHPDGGDIIGREKECLDRLNLLCCEHHQQIHKDKYHKFNPLNFNNGRNTTRG